VNYPNVRFPCQHFGRLLDVQLSQARFVVARGKNREHIDARYCYQREQFRRQGDLIQDHYVRSISQVNYFKQIRFAQI
jgi:hypothetical protein